MRPRNSFDKASLTIIVICIALCTISFPFLSNTIAIQWNGRDVSNTANRLFIFVLPLISLAIYRVRFSLVSASLARRGRSLEDERLISYITLFVEILLLSGAIEIVLFDRGIPLTVGSIFVIEVAIGIILGLRMKHKGA